MSELETTVDDVTTDVETEIDTPETTEVESETPEEVTYEQALEWKKKAERLEKAEKTLVEQKRKLKELESKSSLPADEQIMTKFDFELEKFIDKNPDVAEYRDEIAKIAKEKKLTLAQAKILVEADDKTIANRKKTTLSRVSDGDTPEPNTYSKDYLAKLDPRNPKDKETYNRIMDKVEA